MIVLTGNVDGQFSAAFECHSFTLKKNKTLNSGS